MPPYDARYRGYFYNKWVLGGSTTHGEKGHPPAATGRTSQPPLPSCAGSLRLTYTTALLLRLNDVLGYIHESACLQ